MRAATCCFTSASRSDSRSASSSAASASCAAPAGARSSASVVSGACLSPTARRHQLRVGYLLAFLLLSESRGSTSAGRWGAWGGGALYVHRVSGGRERQVEV